MKPKPNRKKEKKQECAHIWTTWVSENSYKSYDECIKCSKMRDFKDDSPSPAEGEEWEKAFYRAFNGYFDWDTTDAITEFIRSLLFREKLSLLSKIQSDIEENEVPWGYGSASGGVMKSMILKYLEGLKKGI